MTRRPLAALAAALLAVACDAPAPPPAEATSSAAPAASPATAPSAASAAPTESAVAPPDASAAPSGSGAASGPAASATPAADAGTDAGQGDGGKKPVKDAGVVTATDAGTAGGTPAADGGAVAAADAGAEPAPASLPPAEPGSADAVAAEVDAIYTGIAGYAAKFKQEHTQKVAGVVRKQSGSVLVQKPNRISFRYDPPTKNRIVSDGLTLKIYVAEDQQMFVTPVQNSEYPGALSFLMGRGLRPSFTFTFNDKAKFEGGPVLVGKPRSPSAHYESVLFYIDKARLAKKDLGTIRRVLILDVQQNRNRFDFEGATEPKSIDPAEFQFTPPSGTDIKQN